MRTVSCQALSRRLFVGREESPIDDIGNFEASVVREWDDGFAVAFDMDEDDKYSLQEDLEEFRRERDIA